MAKVFLGGSRHISRLNQATRAKLDEWMKKRTWFLVGDANGADKAFQAYLAEAGYLHVTVYHVGQCRNNLGAWPEKTVETGASQRGFAHYAAKDAAMAQEADCGFMLWDEKSKGTFNNIETLARLGKKTLVYVSTRKAFYRIACTQDIEEFLREFDPRLIEELRSKIREKLPSEAQMRLPVAG
ncbi:MAG: hypothetical protein N2036_14870 [Bryobacteraceae bacterium]|nr:hypothetical protein [Bryobacteraceae bacterium]